jgi:hypothetical protein
LWPCRRTPSRLNNPNRVPGTLLICGGESSNEVPVDRLIKSGVRQDRIMFVTIIAASQVRVTYTHSTPGVTLVTRTGCRVYGLWFMVYGLWFMVYGLWFMVYGLWFMVYGLWFMVYGLWFMV